MKRTSYKAMLLSAVMLAALLPAGYVPAHAQAADPPTYSPAGYSMAEGTLQAEAGNGLTIRRESAPLVRADNAEITASADLFFLEEGYTEYISIPAGFQQSYQIELDAQDVTYSVSDHHIAVDDNGLVTLQGEEVYFIGYGYVTEYQAGTYYVYADTDSVRYTYEIRVQDYAQFYADAVISEYMDTHITEDMTALEKIEAVCEFVAGYDYSADHSGMLSMIVSGEGGDCWASTSTVNYMCGLLGMQARTRDASGDPGAGSGHRNSVVSADGVIYMVDAGYNSTAPRPYSIEAYASAFVYTERPDGTAEITEYLGFDSEITVPETIDGHTVAAIGAAVFYDCNFFLEEPVSAVTLPDTIVKIGDAAFADCTGLKELYLPAGVALVEKAAFNGCTELNLMIDPDNPYLTTQDGILFTSDFTTLLGAYCFAGGSYDVPEGVMYIQSQAFANLRSLTDVTFPDTLVDIGYRAFNSTGLRGSNLVLPESVTGIGFGAFYSCDAASITILNPDCVINNTTENGLNEQENGMTLGGFGAYSASPLLVGYPDSTAQAYAEEFAEYTTTRTVSAADGSSYTETITGPGYLFAEYSETERRVLETGTTSGGTEWEFSWSREEGTVLRLTADGALTEQLFEEEADLPETFRCMIVSRIVLEDGITGIGDGALANLSSARDIVIPASVRSISGNPFGSNLRKIYGYTGSYAQTFALGNGYTFVPLISTVQGDVNNDGRLSVLDAAAMQKYLLCLGTLEHPGNAELTGDDVLNGFDLALLKRMLLAQPR